MDLMVNDFTYKAFKERTLVLFEGFAKRTFIHVKDAAQAYIFALEHFDEMKGNVFNSGADRLNYSKLEIAEKIREKVEFEIIQSELQDKDLRHFYVDFSRIKKLGYEPVISLDEGINELIRVYGFYEYYSHYRPI